MKKTMKILVTVMCLIMALSMSVTYVGAAQIGGETAVQPRWMYVDIIETDVYEYDGVGYAETVCYGFEGVSRIKIDIYVYKVIDGTRFHLTAAHGTINDQTGGLVCEFTPVAGMTYRAEYWYQVTKQGITESIMRAHEATF